MVIISYIIYHIFSSYNLHILQKTYKYTKKDSQKATMALSSGPFLSTNRVLWRGSECLGFWICQRSEYTGFWIYQGCEYTRVLNMLLVLNMSGFWIYHGSKYARVAQGFEYAWICLNNSWIWLIMPECPKIFLDGFCFTFTHCNSLSKGTVYCFLGK